MSIIRQIMEHTKTLLYKTRSCKEIVRFYFLFSSFHCQLVGLTFANNLFEALQQISGEKKEKAWTL